MKNTLAFDIGGTNIKYGFVNEDYEISRAKKTHTQTNQIISQLEKIIEKELLNHPEIDSIAIATTGAVDDVNQKIHYTNNNVSNYSGVNFRELSDKFHLPLIVINDANAAALAEYLDVEWKFSNFATITFGTGVGAGIVLNNKIFSGANFLGGEIGHMKLHNVTVDALLSFSKFNEQYRKYQKIHQKDNLSELYLQLWDEDANFRQKLEQYLKLMANFLFNIAVVLNLEHIVIAGGISHIDHKFLSVLFKNFQQNLKNTPFTTTINISQFKNHAGLLGAVYYLRNQNHLKS